MRVNINESVCIPIIFTHGSGEVNGQTRYVPYHTVLICRLGAYLNAIGFWSMVCVSMVPLLVLTSDAGPV